jgi:hypothetical protein
MAGQGKDCKIFAKYLCAIQPKVNLLLYCRLLKKMCSFIL